MIRAILLAGCVVAIIAMINAGVVTMPIGVVMGVVALLLLLR